jgi:hypothetical protein
MSIEADDDGDDAGGNGSIVAVVSLVLLLLLLSMLSLLYSTRPAYDMKIKSRTICSNERTNNAGNRGEQ